MNEQQLLMLKLFKKPLPEADFIKIRRLAVELLGNQLDEPVEGWEEKNEITEDYYIELSKGHFRLKKKLPVQVALILQFVFYCSSIRH